MDHILTLEKIRPYIFHIITFTMLITILFATNNLCIGTLNGISVYGDCQLLSDHSEEQAVLTNLGIGEGVSSPDGIVGYIKPKPNPLHQIGATMQIDTNTYIINTTTSTTSTSTTTTTTTIPCPDIIPCVCDVCTKTACPELDDDKVDKYEFQQILLDEINTWRPKGAPAVQHGWYQMRTRLTEYMGGKGSKYREGPSISYQNVKTREETHVFQILKDENECFTLSQYPDQNGRKRWNWNKQECLTSNITICHL